MMKMAWRIFTDDIRRLEGNIIAIVIICGLILLPSLYAWFSLLAFWNPEDNTGNVSVAVANEDAGYQSDLIPTRIDAGAQVVDQLRANAKFDWVFVGKDDAVEGVKSGRYYAAIVIPEDFSADLVSVFSDHLENPAIDYYVNEKENPIAPHLTSIGASTIQADIDQTFTSTVTDIALGTNSNLAQFMEGKGLASYAETLLASLKEAETELQGDAGQVRAFGALLGQTETLIQTSSGALDRTGQIAQQIDPLVDSTRSGLDQTVNATDNMIGLAQAAVGNARGSFDAIDASASSAFDSMKQDPAALQQVIGDLRNGLATTRGAYQSAYDQLRALDPTSALLPALQGVIGQIEALSSTLGEISGDIGNDAANLEQARARLSDALGSARSALDQVEAQYGDNLRSQADGLRTSLDALGGDTKRIAEQLSQAMGTLAGSSQPLASSIGDVRASMEATASLLQEAADGLARSHGQLEEALGKGDLDEVRRIIGDNPDQLAQTLAAPTGIQKHPVYAVADYGSAMSPFYTSLALFIGVIFLMIILKTQLTSERREELGNPSPTQEYIGNGLFLLTITLAQALLLCTGNLFFLGVQCESIPLYYLTGLVCAFVFFNLIYALVVAFGDIGKAIVVILLVMQVAGSGGELPIQLSAPIFQAIYPWLPFTHSMNLFQGAVAGVYGDQYLVSMLILLAFVIPALILGLVLRKPIMRFNAFIGEQLDKTGVV